MIDPRALAKDSLIEEDFLLELKANGVSGYTLGNYKRAVETLGGLDTDLEALKKRHFVKWAAEILDDYAESSASLYKTCVKRYMRWLKNGELNGGEYPDCVRWMKTSNNGNDLPKEILSHDEIKQMAETADNQRDRTMIWAGYESGCRSGELLGMRIEDVQFDGYGAQVMVNGKTGERRIRLVESVPDLRVWLSMHPDNENRTACLWPTNRSEHLSVVDWWKNLKKYAEKAGINKNVYPHLLRHSRATHLASKGLNEAQMREIFGWKKDSNMPSVYVHLSGRDTDKAVLSLYDIDVESSKNQLEMGVKKCSFCGHENSPNAKFCDECNAPLDSMAAEQANKKVTKQDDHVRKLLEFIREEHPKALLDFYEKSGNIEEIRKLGESRI